MSINNHSETMKRKSVCLCEPGKAIFKERLTLEADTKCNTCLSNGPLVSSYFPDDCQYQWCIEFHPVHPKSLFVNSFEDNDSPRADFVILFSNQQSVQFNWCANRAEELRVAIPVDYKELMKMSSLTVDITLTVTLEGQHADIVEKRPRMIRDQYKSLLESQIGTDIVIKTSNGQLTAHWAVLAARSPYFLALLKNDFNEKREEIQLEISLEIGRKILEFVYSGDAHFASTDDGIALLKAGDMYLMDDLKKKAEKYLCTSLNEGNALDILIHSHLHNANKLKRNALDVLANHRTSTADNPNFPVLLKYPDLAADLFRR